MADGTEGAGARPKLPRRARPRRPACIRARSLARMRGARARVLHGGRKEEERTVIVHQTDREDLTGAELSHVEPREDRHEGFLVSESELAAPSAVPPACRAPRDFDARPRDAFAGRTRSDEGPVGEEGRTLWA